RVPLIPFHVSPGNHARSAMNAHNLGWPLKRAPHERDAVDLLNVSHSLGPRTGEVQARDAATAHDLQQIRATLGRPIYLTVRGGRPHKEHVLTVNEVRDVAVKRGVFGCHSYTSRLTSRPEITAVRRALRASRSAQSPSNSSTAAVPVCKP